MIFDPRARITQAPVEVALPQFAPCRICRGALVATVLPFPVAQYPGEVRYQCAGCGTIETAAMRAAASGKACLVCGQPVPPKPTTGGVQKRYCSKPCRMEQARRYASRKRQARQSGGTLGIDDVTPRPRKFLDGKMLRKGQEVAA